MNWRFPTRCRLLLLACLLALAPLPARGASARAGRFAVTLTTRPYPPVAGQNLFIVTLRDKDQPLAGAGVDLRLDMLDMPMPTQAQAAPGEQAGEYGAAVSLAMAGKWKVTVAVQQMAGMAMAGDGQAEFLLETGQGITPAARPLSWRWWLLGAMVLVLGAVAARYRHRLAGRGRGVAVGLLTLAVVLAATIAVVRKYRDPTVATVIGSATMDMKAMQAPPGAAAVSTELARAGPFQAAAAYTGTVVPDAEEDVYPRVSGRLVYMPYYPGDRVAAGAVVARLQAQELLASARSAQGGVQAARSEVTGTWRQAEEAKSGAAAVQAGLEQAQQAVTQSRSEVESAQAELTYWQAEIAREQKLYQLGAVAREELERETAQAAAARARLSQAQAGVRTAQAGVARARQELAAARARQQAAQAAIATAQARVQEAQARQAEAGTLSGYTEIRAANGGVVTARLVAPGVVVQPGMAILKIAKTDYVRLQAAVSEADLAALRPGDTITVRSLQGGRPLSARITAVFPARDVATRTSIVEARVPNPGGRLQPGQYLAVTLHLGPRTPALSVPNAALVRRDGQASLFLAAHDGFLTRARRVAVTTGLATNERTQLLSGLQEGDLVIVAGQGNLRDGDPIRIVQGPTPGAPAPQAPIRAGYRCPMHPEMVSDRPGQCPKCGMDYVPRKS